MLAVVTDSGIVRYRTAGLRIFNTRCVHFLLLLVLYLQDGDCSFNYKYRLWHSDCYRFVVRMQNYTFINKTGGIYNMYGKVAFGNPV